MENFDRENIDELLKIYQIRQYFLLSKFCAVQYVSYVAYLICLCRNRRGKKHHYLNYLNSFTAIHSTNAVIVKAIVGLSLKMKD